MRKLLPFVHPSFCSVSSSALARICPSGSLSAYIMSTPIARCVCCPRAAIGHAAVAPPRSVMNSRRLMGTPRQAKAAHYHAVAEERRFASQQNLRANVAEESNSAVLFYARTSASANCGHELSLQEGGCSRDRSLPQYCR